VPTALGGCMQSLSDQMSGEVDTEVVDFVGDIVASGSRPGCLQDGSRYAT
jgi:hypothetical protein